MCAGCEDDMMGGVKMGQRGALMKGRICDNINCTRRRNVGRSDATVGVGVGVGIT